MKMLVSRGFIVFLSLFFISQLALAKSYSLRNRIQSLTKARFFDLQTTVAELKEIDENGCNALHHAATLNDVSLFKFLLDIGIKANTTDKDGLRPLDYATREAEENPTSKQMLFVSYILEMIEGVNGVDDSGWPPIYWAILAGNLERVKELVDKKTKDRFLYSDYNNGGATDAYSLALLMKNEEIIKLLTIRKNMIDLGNAVFFGEIDRIKELVDAGGDLNRIRFNGRTTTALLLGEDQTNDDIKYFKFLIGFGADVNASDQEGLTPLKVASSPSRLNHHYGYVRENSRKMVKFLEGMGATK